MHIIVCAILDYNNGIKDSNEHLDDFFQLTFCPSTYFPVQNDQTTNDNML